MLREGMQTPWGQADQVYNYCDGIGRVCTPSHGGIKLSRERNAKIPMALRREGGWYEEDCDWAIPYYFFADELKAVGQDAGGDAIATLKNWMPHEFAAATDIEVLPSESSALREELFYKANSDKFIVTAAWGDWQGGVPTGMVGVLAIIGGRSATGLAKDHPPEHWFLVPKDEYNDVYNNDPSSRRVGFVIDPARHIEVEDFSKLPHK